MGLSVVSRPSLVLMIVFSASLDPGLSPCIAPVVRKMASLNLSAPVRLTFMRKSKVTVSLVSLLLFFDVLPMARLMFFLVCKACMATSLHFLSRMLSCLIALLMAKPCLSLCRWKCGSALAMTLAFGCSLSMMFHVKHLIPVPLRSSTLKQWR